MEKLISMTDYVLLDKHAGSPINMNKQYAHFLKQPLKLGMFIPCDEEGNVLEDPENTMKQGDGHVYYSADDEDFKKYEQAKERVLFEGFEYCNKMEYVHNGLISIDEEFMQGKTIEDLIPYNLTLIEK